MTKLRIPDVLDQFVAYYRENLAWGSLHSVLDDDNVGDDSVQSTIAWAEGRGDAAGAELARLLLQMSKTQRRKLPNVVWRRWDEGQKGNHA